MTSRAGSIVGVVGAAVPRGKHADSQDSPSDPSISAGDARRWSAGEALPIGVVSGLALAP